MKSRDYVSLTPSKIRTALSCPRAYYYRYEQQIEKAQKASALIFGSAVHKAIEAAYGLKPDRRPAEYFCDIAASNILLADADSGIEYKEVRGKLETAEELAGKAADLVKAWYDAFYEDVLRSESVNIEKMLRADFAGLTFFGYTDVVEILDGKLLVGDHKTAGSWGDSDEKLVHRNIQFTGYAYLVWKALGRVPDEIYITVLKKTKTPEVFRVYTRRTEDELVAFELYLQNVARLIAGFRDSDYPENYDMGCGWCDYAPLCWREDGAEGLYKERERRAG